MLSQETFTRSFPLRNAFQILEITAGSVHTFMLIITYVYRIWITFDVVFCLYKDLRH